MTREADDVILSAGLGRAHYRMLFVIARRDGVTVGDLRASLGITAQAMQRPLGNLLDRGHVVVSRNPDRHRYKALHLTLSGRTLEKAASDAERNVIRTAFERVDADAIRGWWAVMQGISKEA